MKKKRKFDPNPNTPLDNWTVNVDPAIMSGDHWVQEENAPLEEINFFDHENCENENVIKEHPYDLFMHPVINVSYGNNYEKTDKKK